MSDFQRELQALLSKHSMEAVPVLTCLYGFVERGEAVTQESSKQEVRRIRAVLQARGSNVTDQHSNLEQRPTARERAQRADPCRCAEVAVLPETTNRLGAGKHYAGCGFHDRWKLIETEIEAAVAAARAERDREWRYQVYMALEHEVSGTPTEVLAILIGECETAAREHGRG